MSTIQPRPVLGPGASPKRASAPNPQQKPGFSPWESVELSFGDKTKNFVRDAAGLATPILAATGIGVVMASSGADISNFSAAAMAIGGIMGVAMSTVMTAHGLESVVTGNYGVPMRDRTPGF